MVVIFNGFVIIFALFVVIFNGFVVIIAGFVGKIGVNKKVGRFPLRNASYKKGGNENVAVFNYNLPIISKFKP